jgi:hypothetical protein
MSAGIRAKPENDLQRTSAGRRVSSGRLVSSDSLIAQEGGESMLPISKPGIFLIVAALVTATPPLTGHAQDLTVDSAVTSLPS